VVHWLIRGRVQGVGFRAYVRRAALRHGVGGDVRNLPDGRVELRAAASTSTLEPFLDAVRRGPPGGQIAGVEPVVPPQDPGCDGFEIRF
jgi:acylphosphatase